MPVEALPRHRSQEVRRMLEKLGWTLHDRSINFLSHDDWGKLKRSLRNSDADINVFEASNRQLNRKAVSDDRLDVLLSPEAAEVDEVLAAKACENEVSVALSLRNLIDSNYRAELLSDWRIILDTVASQDARYMVTTEAETKWQPRSPRAVRSLVDTLGFDGKAAIRTHRQVTGNGDKEEEAGGST